MFQVGDKILIKGLSHLSKWEDSECEITEVTDTSLWLKRVSDGHTGLIGKSSMYITLLPTTLENE